MTENTELLNKINALMALAERAGSEHEAALAMERAQRLMVKYAIEQADIDAHATGKRREEIVVVQVTDSNMKAAQLRGVNRMLWGAAATGAGVQMVFIQTRRGAQADGYVELVGYESDIAFCRALHASLHIQRERYLLAAKALKPEGVFPNRFAHSFRLAFASRVYTRLSQARKRNQQEAAAETTNAARAEVALVERDSAVTAAFDQRHNPKSLTQSKFRATSNAGASAGARAGDHADISGGRNHVGTRGLQELLP